MVYRVSTTTNSERDLALLYSQVDANTSAAANRWYLGLKAAILSLEHQPNRCTMIRKKERLRHLLYGKQAQYLSGNIPHQRETKAS
jgi:hypothetical protein